MSHLYACLFPTVAVTTAHPQGSMMHIYYLTGLGGQKPHRAKTPGVSGAGAFSRRQGRTCLLHFPASTDHPHCLAPWSPPPSSSPAEGGPTSLTSHHSAPRSPSLARFEGRCAYTERIRIIQDHLRLKVSSRPTLALPATVIPLCHVREHAHLLWG